VTGTRPAGSLPLLYSVVVVDLIGFGILMPILPFYAVEFGASGRELGVVLAAYAAAQLLMAPVWGRLSDRLGRRPVLLLTIAGTSASLLLLSVATSLFWLLVARVLAGAFAANVSVASAYISDVTSDDERTRYMGLLGACFAVGFVLGPAIGGLLAPWGHQLPLRVAAGLAACNAVYAAIALREPPGRRRAARGAGRLAALRDPLVRRLCLVNLAFSLAVTQLEAMFALFMKDRFAYGERDVAFLLIGMAVVMGGIQAGAMRRLAARYPERSLLVWGSAGLAVAFAALPTAPSVALLLIPLTLAAIGRGVAQPAMLGMASLAAPEEERGLVLGSFQSAASLARVIGPVAAGLLYDRSTSGPFQLAAVLLVGVVVLAARMPRRGGARPAGADGGEPPRPWTSRSSPA
jgi:DHA1 family tetracycline resistance protein-like MFS transporter